jgi:pterin-4a-carbinolamine dehydratase
MTKAEQAPQNGIQQPSAWQVRNMDREIRRILTCKAYYQAFLWGIG